MHNVLDTTTLPTPARQRAAYTLTARQRSKNKGNIAVFLCVDTLNGEGRDLCLTGERVPQTSQHTPSDRQGKKLSSNFLSKSWKVSCFCCAILQFLTLHRRLFVCTRTSYVIKRQASTTGGAPPSGAPTIGTVCVGGWVCGRRCKRVFSRSSGEETRIIFNPTCRRGDLQQVFMRWT